MFHAIHAAHVHLNGLLPSQTVETPVKNRACTPSKAKSRPSTLPPANNVPARMQAWSTRTCMDPSAARCTCFAA